MQRLCLFVAVLLLLAVPALAEEVRVETEWKTLVSDRTTPQPVRTSSKTLEIHAEPPAGAPALPEGVTAQGHISFELAGKTLHIVLAGSTPDATEPDRLAIDRNGDGRFDEGELETVALEELKARDGTVRGHRILLRDVDFALGERTYRTYLLAQRWLGAAWTFRLITFWYLEGTVALGGQEYIVNLVDNDQDGAFDGPKDLWLVRTTEPVQGPTNTFSMSARGEGRFLDGRRFVVKAVQGTGVTLAATAAEGPDPGDDAKARARVEHLWVERFDKEREDFVKLRGLDTSRARAEAPIRWRYITFAEAKKLAAQEQKALFVDLMAFWCVWCYRMDYYTYVDAEVARLLNEKFIAVKIIKEQDRADDYQVVREQLKARGIPAMGIWGPDGELRRMIGGWKKPEDFLTELREGLKDPDAIDVSDE